MTRTIRIALFTAALFAPVCAAWADNGPRITLSASQATAPINTPIDLQVTVSGAGTSAIGEPLIEGIEHFEILGTSSGEQLAIVNMSVARSAVYTFTVRAKKAGERIPLRAKAAVGGANYLSNSIEVSTVAGSGGGTHPRFPFGAGRTYGKDDFILQARISPATPYVGQEAVYTLSLYRAPDVMADINFIPPEFKNLWVEKPDADQASNGRPARLGGRDYILSEIRLFAYPLAAGDIHIPSGRANILPTPFSPAITLHGNELSVRVRPLPEKGKPEGFNGPAGSFSIGAALAKTSVAAGEPATLTVTVSGNGAVHAIQRPVEPVIDAELYDPETKDLFRRGTNGSEGSRSFQYIMVPRKLGTLAIGGFSFSFFDPASATYKTIATPPLSLMVTAAAAGDPKTPSTPPANPGASGASWNWLFVALAAAGALAALWKTKRGTRKTAQPQRVEQVARQYLKDAEDSLARGDRSAFFAALEHAVRHHLADRSGLSPSAITPDDNALRLAPGSEPAYTECLAVLRICIEARYSPAPFKEGEALLRRAKTCIAGNG